MTIQKARPLSDKQRLFCNEYMIDLNATQAAIRAGYSKKTAQRIGSENLSKPLIAEKLAELKEKRSKRTEIDADMVIKGILEVITDAKVGKETETGVSMNNHAAALKGYELLGKHLVMFTDKTEHAGAVEITTIERVIIKS